MTERAPDDDLNAVMEDVMPTEGWLLVERVERPWREWSRGGVPEADPGAEETRLWCRSRWTKSYTPVPGAAGAPEDVHAQLGPYHPRHATFLVAVFVDGRRLRDYATDDLGEAVAWADAVAARGAAGHLTDLSAVELRALAVDVAALAETLDAGWSWTRVERTAGDVHRLAHMLDEALARLSGGWTIH